MIVMTSCFPNMASIPSSLALNPIGFNSKFSVFSSYHLVPPISNTLSKWIIEIGATDHMIYFISLFTSITAKIFTNVKLQNGKYTHVTHIGTVQISANLTFTNVLCVPSFFFNLLANSSNPLLVVSFCMLTSALFRT